MVEMISEYEYDCFVEQVMDFCEKQLDFNESVHAVHMAIQATLNKQTMLINDLEKRLYMLENSSSNIIRTVQ